MSQWIHNLSVFKIYHLQWTTHFKSASVFFSFLFFFRTLKKCCEMRWKTKCPTALAARVMHSLPALVKSPSSRIIRDWKGRCGGKGGVEGGGGGAMDWEQKRGRKDHGSSCGAEMLLNGPRSLWVIKLMTDGSLENALLLRACNHPSSPECGREELTRNTKKPFHNRQHAFSSCIQRIDMLADIHSVMHSADSQSKHVHAIKKQPLFHKHSYSYYTSTLWLQVSISDPSLQSAGWISFVPSNTDTICISSLLSLRLRLLNVPNTKKKKKKKKKGTINLTEQLNKLIPQCRIYNSVLRKSRYRRLFVPQLIGFLENRYIFSTLMASCDDIRLTRGCKASDNLTCWVEQLHGVRHNQTTVQMK